MLHGLTLDQASNGSLALAVVVVVSDVLGVPPSSVSDVSVAANRRMLLAGVRISYNITVTSTKTAETLIATLLESMFSGKFAEILSYKSGLSVSSVSGLAVVNLSPTTSPTASPIENNRGKAYEV